MTDLTHCSIQMARRHGSILLRSILQTAQAHLAAAADILSAQSGAQLTSLYQNLLQPQQLTCLRSFNGSSLALTPSATIPLGKVIICFNQCQFLQTQCSLTSQRPIHAGMLSHQFLCLQEPAADAVKSTAKPSRRGSKSTKVFQPKFTTVRTCQVLHLLAPVNVCAYVTKTAS